MSATRRLILIRHAKSGWDDLMADDHERTLTDRGHTAAAAIGGWLQSKRFVPKILLSSDATRTVQTTDAVLRGITTKVDVRFVPMLYHAAPDTVQDIAAAMTEQTVAIVAHNPGIGMLASRLARSRPQHRRFDDYPTCATTVIDFATDDWMQAGKGIVTAFVTPRDLTQ
jgi:phosphohistidine phosphatase